jgi:hypothetical protein
MAALAEVSESRNGRLYALVEDYDRFVGVIVNRPHGLDTQRPQDYLACMLTARSFRLMIGGLLLSASGYGDLSPNLGRTIWEIGLRLYYAQTDPVAASLGFFAHSARRNLEALQAELAHRRSLGEDVGYLALNCARLHEREQWLTDLASATRASIWCRRG